MKRLAAAFLSILFVAVPALLGATAQAQEQPRLRVDIAGFSPRVITSSATELTVAGKITNVGDRRISRAQVRLELGERQTTERQVTDVLAGGVFKATPLSEFTTVAESLEPGQSAPMTVTVNLTGSKAAQFAKTGVYPLLVNVNGTPDFGGAARLGAVSLLLPVLSSPGKQAGSHSGGPSVTLLWPITDTVPHVYSAAYGGALTLSDETLADELGPDGRLTALVSAARTAIQADTKLGTALCFAIDPDLLATVNAMSNGYQAHTDAGTVAGKGTNAAKAWLASLRTLVTGRCVIAMPFADADLNALTGITRDGTADTDLFTRATTASDTFTQVLGVTPQSGVLWPDGMPNEAAMAALPQAGIKTVLTDAGGLQATGAGGGGGVTVQGSTVRAQPTDSLITAALTGVPAAAGSVTTAATDQPAVASQNGLGALAFRAGLGQPNAENPNHLLVAPPRRWDVPAAELSAYLEQISTFLSSGLVTASGLTQLLAADPTGSGSVGESGQGPAAGVDPSVTAALSRLDDQAVGLTSAMTIDPTKRVKPEDVVLPVRDALLRGASAAWRGTSAEVATTNAQADVAAISGQVTVQQPKQTIALASGASPLPVYVSNDLPVGINARISINNNTGLRPEQAQASFFPAKANRNQYVPVEALRAGRFSVDVSLSTPAGTPLGSAARFELTSTEYGAITIIATVVAGVALLLLASRRIYRRVKDARAGRVVTD